jgi:hypothetical protein
MRNQEAPVDPDQLKEQMQVSRFKNQSAMRTKAEGMMSRSGIRRYGEFSDDHDS